MNALRDALLLTAVTATAAMLAFGQGGGSRGPDGRGYERRIDTGLLRYLDTSHLAPFRAAARGAWPGDE